MSGFSANEKLVEAVKKEGANLMASSYLPMMTLTLAVTNQNFKVLR